MRQNLDGQSPAKVSHKSTLMEHLFQEDFRYHLKRFFWPPIDCCYEQVRRKEAACVCGSDLCKKHD